MNNYIVLYPKDGFVVFDRRKILHDLCPPIGARGKIDSFSSKSRSRLSFIDRNLEGHFTQFLLTYHQNAPLDGRVCKTHLDNFLKCLRRNFPGIRYLWVLEFQANGNPHYHFFSDISCTRANRIFLATTWNRVTSESLEHLQFHSHKKNFFKWEFGSGYVSKYLSKEHQKMVPDSYYNVGRFWGTSRGLLESPVVVEIDQLLSFGDSTTKRNAFVYFLLRYIRFCHNNLLARYGKKSFINVFINRVIKNGRCRIPNLNKFVFNFLNYFLANKKFMEYSSLMDETVFNF